MDLTPYLLPTYYLDCDNSDIISFAKTHTKAGSSDMQKAIDLYYVVRDKFAYNPYNVILEPAVLKASYMLTKDYGYCIEKSNLYAAALRALGIPTRLGYANVRNHLGTKKLEEKLGTDVLVFHGYVEVYLQNKWIKVTPVFDSKLCQKLGVDPLPFDGENDSYFQSCDKAGNNFMEYLHYYGVFADFPFNDFVANLKLYYGHLFEETENNNYIFKLNV